MAKLFCTFYPTLTLSTRDLLLDPSAWGSNHLFPQSNSLNLLNDALSWAVKLPYFIDEESKEQRNSAICPQLDNCKYGGGNPSFAIFLRSCVTWSKSQIYIFLS